MNSAQQPSSFIMPILGDRGAPSAADTLVQHNQPSVPQTGDGHTQHAQDTMLSLAPPNDQACQHQALKADVRSGGCDSTAISHSNGSTGHSPQVSYPSSSVGNDADSEYDGGDEDEDTNGDEENEKFGVDDDLNKDDVTEHCHAWVALPETDAEIDSLPAKERRDVMRYRELDDIDMEMVMDAGYCPAEVMAAGARTQARLQSNLKRARWEISEGEEIEELQNKRTKRIKRGGDTAGASSQGFPESQGPYSQKGQQPIHFEHSYRRKRKGQRALSSHIQKLHKDRLRRRVFNRMYNYGYYPQPDIVVYANYNNAIGEPQSQPSSHRQRPAGSERTNPTLNPTVEHTAANTMGRVPRGAPEGDGSNTTENQPDPGEMAQSNAHTMSRRQYQQPAVNTVRDDPFFSDELFNGMLNGQPDTSHVGSMYTRSHQRDIDDYYQRVMGSGLENDNLGNPMPSSAQQPLTRNTPGAPIHGGNAPPVAQLPGGLTRPAPASIRDLDYGDIADWDAAWLSFVKDHDGKALLRGHYPDEYE